MSKEDARYAARRAFGNVGLIREQTHDAWGVAPLERLLQDFRYALRGLIRNPGFAVVAVMTLALGIGANTAVFSVIDAVMLRALPVREPGQLVQVAFQGKHDATSFVGESFSYPLFNQLRNENPAFADLAAFDSWDSLEAQAMDSDPSDSGAPIKGQLVSVNFFSMLGLNAALGRTFTAEDGHEAAPVAVISYAVWEHGFAGSPHAIGSKLLIRGVPLTVIGVAQAHFSGVNPGTNYGVWIPLTMAAQVLSEGHSSLTDVSTNWLSLIGRLQPDLTSRQASERLDALFQHLQSERDISGFSAQEQRDFFTHGGDAAAVGNAVWHPGLRSDHLCRHGRAAAGGECCGQHRDGLAGGAARSDSNAEGTVALPSAGSMGLKRVASVVQNSEGDPSFDAAKRRD